VTVDIDIEMTLTKKSMIFFIGIVILITVVLVCLPSLTFQDANGQQQEQQLSADAIFKKVEKSIVGITTPETIEEEADDFASNPIYDGSGFVYAKELMSM
jgi:hypothetical protein